MPVSRRSIRSARAKENKRESARGRQPSYEQYGSAEERAPYLEMSIGRPVLGGELLEITERIGKKVGLRALSSLGLIYLPGAKIAPEVRFGFLHPEKPRIPAEEIITLISEKMRDPNLNPSMRLAESSAKALDVKLADIVPRSWGSKFRAVAKLNDVQTDEYITEGLLFGEKAAVCQRFKSPIHDLQKPLNNGDLFIHFAEGESREVATFQTAAFLGTALRDTVITLGPVGPLETPKL